MTTTALSTISPQNLTQAGDLLGRAFFHVPLFATLQPSEDVRARGLRTVFRAVVRHAARRGDVITSPEGVVAWLAVERIEATLSDIVLCGFLPLAFRYGFKATWRLLAHDAWCTKRIHALAPASTGYLYVVGVEPDLAGRGHGTLLARQALQQISKRYTHCMVRTERPKNVRFYEKLGFRCVEHAVVPSTGVPTWLLLTTFANTPLLPPSGRGEGQPR